MPDAAQTPVATITGQVESVGPGANNKITDGITVYFTTAKGVKGSVFLSRDAYSVDNALAAVKEAATQRDSLQGMPVV